MGLQLHIILANEIPWISTANKVLLVYVKLKSKLNELCIY